MKKETESIPNELTATGLLAAQRFRQREQALYHPTYDQELAFYELVQSGNLTALRQKKDWAYGNEPERGTLSKHPVRNMRYHLIVLIALLTRFCIEGGMAEQEAYQLSDFYIEKIDETETISALQALQKDVIFDFAERMHKKKMIQNHSVHCQKALDYIYDHLHQKIDIKEIADYVGINETYLSKLFAKETGLPIAAYIRKQRIAESQNMLTYSDYACSEIAQYLGFASSSHFSESFKKEVGMTPLHYRNTHYRKHWKES